MRFLAVPGWLLLVFLWATRMFLVGLQVSMTRYFPQPTRELDYALSGYPAPGNLRDRYLHPLTYRRQFFAEIEGGHLLLHPLPPMLAPQRRLHHAQHVVGRHTHGKAKQGGLRVGQRIDLTLQHGDQIVESCLDGPALAVSGHDEDGLSL